MSCGDSCIRSWRRWRTRRARRRAANPPRSRPRRDSCPIADVEKRRGSKAPASPPFGSRRRPLRPPAATPVRERRFSAPRPRASCRSRWPRRWRKLAAPEAVAPARTRTTRGLRLSSSPPQEVRRRGRRSHFRQVRGKLEKSKEAVIAKHQCADVRFQVYVKDAQAALRPCRRAEVQNGRGRGRGAPLSLRDQPCTLELEARRSTSDASNGRVMSYSHFPPASASTSCSDSDQFRGMAEVYRAKVTGAEKFQARGYQVHAAAAQRRPAIHDHVHRRGESSPPSSPTPTSCRSTSSVASTSSSTSPWSSSTVAT